MMKRMLRWFTPARLAAACTAVVFAAAFAISWESLRVLALAAGIRPLLAPLYPLTIHAVMVTGTVAAVALRAAHWRIRAYTWLMVGAGIVVSVVGNAVHSSAHDEILSLPLWSAAAASGVPALSLAASLHLFVITLRHARQAAQESALDVARVEVADAHVVSAHEEVPNGRQAVRRNARPAVHSTRTSRARVEAMVRRATTRGRELDARTVAKRLKLSDAHARRLLADARKLHVEERA